jgi:hypothetical protein
MVLLFTVALAAVPASALDLTGTWQGGFKCFEFDGALSRYRVDDATFLISQAGTTLNITWVGEIPLGGLVVADTSKPDTSGFAGLVHCDTDADLTTGFSELAVVKAKVNRPKGKGSLQGAGPYTVDGSRIGVCTIKLRLTDTADPGGAGCTP